MDNNVKDQSSDALVPVIISHLRKEHGVLI